MASFYSIIYNKFAELQVSESDSARFAYPSSDLLPSLKTGRTISDCIVAIPQISLARNAISYGPFVFDDTEFGQVSAVKVIIASISLLSAKSIFRWIYHDYLKEWLAKKADPLRARYAMNIILDIFARQRVRRIQGQAFYDDVMRSADTLSILLLSREPNEYPVMAQAALASFVLHVPLYLPAPIMKVVRSFTSDIKTFSSGTKKIGAIIDEQISRGISATKLTKKQSKWTDVASMCNSLYAIVAKIPGKWHNVYLPYSHPLSNRDLAAISIFQSKLITAEDFNKIKPSVKELRTYDSSVWQETFFELMREIKFREKIMKKLLQATKNLNFGEVMFPVCDFVGFSKMHAQLSPDIRNITERVRLVKNAFDENSFQETGNIDLQVAIQAVASESPRTDIFSRDEELHKDESWTVLVDSSKSLTGSSNDLRAVSICLAETASSILGSNPWGMFAFSDNLHCIKDFAEKYDNMVKARIGGLQIGGLSYIPDAIRACASLVRQNSRDRNFMILVTDGLPSGYTDIDREFGASVRELRGKGINLIAIGIGSKAIRRTVKNARVISKPTDIAKQFMDVYMSQSA
jgi:hypothetical protein